MQWKLEKPGLDPTWSVILENGQNLIWKDFGVGPITLSASDRTHLCEKLLGVKEDAIKALASKALKSFVGEIKKSLILHGTSTDLGAFHGDLAKLRAGQQAKNYAGYVETRAPFLGKPGDLAIGRMSGWKINVAKVGLTALEIPDLDHYYLSDALLLLAAQHLKSPQPVIQKLIRYLQEYPNAVVRLYVLDQHYQLFLTWLQQQAGLEKIYIDANSPAVGFEWNTKDCLYPSVRAAEAMNIGVEENPYQVLEFEKKESKLYKKLGLIFPTIPGYLIERQACTQDDFFQQLWKAAQLLRSRYGLKEACLKACNSGDGARITPHIDLLDSDQLKHLADIAYAYGDNYVLESHFHYAQTEIGRQTINLSPSAHIRSGQLGDGMTLQFTKGTSWVGNLYVDASLAPQVGISEKNYHQMLQTVLQFLESCNEQNPGLVIGGMDFAIGTIGGKFREDSVLGLQDPNISFNGAEFLREYINRVSDSKNWPLGTFYAVTWVFVPLEHCSHTYLEEVLKQHEIQDTDAMVIAVVPNFWAMIGIAALSYALLVEHFEKIQTLIKRELAK